MPVLRQKDVCVFLPISTASQDSGGFLPVKSGSFSRSGTSTWASPIAETAKPTHQHTPPSSSSSISPSSVMASNPSAACSSTANQGPAPLPKAAEAALNPGLVKSPTQKQGSDQGQLEPILEAPPGSPIALVKMSIPYKRKSKYSHFISAWSFCSFRDIGKSCTSQRFS